MLKMSLQKRESLAKARAACAGIPSPGTCREGPRLAETSAREEQGQPGAREDRTLLMCPAVIFVYLS